MVPKRFEYCIINIIVRARPISRVPFSRVLSARLVLFLDQFSSRVALFLELPCCSTIFFSSTCLNISWGFLIQFCKLRKGRDKIPKEFGLLNSVSPVKKSNKRWKLLRISIKHQALKHLVPIRPAQWRV